MFTDTIIGPIPSKAGMLLTIGPLFEQGIKLIQTIAQINQVAKNHNEQKSTVMSYLKATIPRQ